MIYERNEGLFSNINVFQRMICHEFLHNKAHDNYIEMYLTEYDENEDFYPHLFSINKDIDINEVSCNEILKCETKEFGLFQSRVDIESIDIVRKKYLNYSLSVICKSEQIATYLPDEYTFVWYRGTDKKSEAHVIDIKKVVDFAESKKLPLVVKTDEIKFKNYLNENNIKHIMLKGLPEREDGFCLHKNLYTISKKEFFDMYKMTKIEYLQQLLAITIFAQKAQNFVCTPSNIASWVIQNKGTFKNSYVFKDNHTFLYE